MKLIPGSKPFDTSWGRDFISDTRVMAEKLLAEPTYVLPISEFERSLITGNRVDYEALYMEHRRKLWHFFTMTLCDGEERWVVALTDILNAICEESIWAFPAHVNKNDSFTNMRHTVDLFAAETAQMLSECVFLLGDMLPPRLVEEVRHNVIERVIKPYMSSDKNYGNNNWSAICNGCVAMSMIELGLRDEFDASLDKIVHGLNIFLDSYTEDGACMEGALYWRYGFGYFAYAADMICEHTGGRVDLFKSEKVRRMAEFYRYAFVDPPYTVPFSDSGHLLHLHPGLITLLSDRYGFPMIPESSAVRADYDHRWRCTDMVRSLLWTKGFDDDCAESFFKYYENAEWYIKRTASYTIAAKGGHNAEPHNHNDIGSFVFYANGEYIVDDLGWPEYDMSYFDISKRYNYICASSLGHSVPIVDGGAQLPGKEHRADIISVDGQSIVMDISGAYGLELRAVTRSIVCTDSGIEVLDSVSDGHTFIDRIALRIEPCIIDNGVRVGRGKIVADEPVDVKVSTAEFETRYSIGISDTGRYVTAYFVDFIPKNNSKSLKLKMYSLAE